MVLVTQAQLGQFQPANCSGFGGSLSDFGKKSTKKFSTVGSPTKLTDAREFYRLTTAMPQSQRTLAIRGEARRLLYPVCSAQLGGHSLM